MSQSFKSSSEELRVGMSQSFKSSEELNDFFFATSWLVWAIAEILYVPFGALRDLWDFIWG